MRIISNFFIIVFIFLFSINLFSQDFGEISDEELQMTSIEEDPDADAVILFNKSQINITPDFTLEIIRHTRIKILTEAGKEWADISIPYYYKNKIMGLEAASYLPNGDESELDDDDIFNEKIRNYKYKKFAIPGVEVGSVIEYQYTVFSDYISNLDPWYFQASEYTKLSEIKVLLPPGFDYSALQKNWYPHDIKKSKEEVWNPYRAGKKVTQFVWTGRNLPAIRKEPYMNAFHDYYAQILFQLVSFKNEYFNKTYAKSWDDIAKHRYEVFESNIAAGGDQLDFIESQIKEISDPLLKTKKVFEYVRSEIKTEDGGGWYPSEDPETVFEEKKGNASEKNVLFLNLLNHLGIKAEPLLISTKSHGKLFRDWVQTQQFNRTIAYVTIGKEKYFLDTSDKFCSFGCLTPETKVGFGFLMKEESGKIIKIKPLKVKNKTEIITNATLGEDGTISAETQITYRGFRALSERKQINKKKDISDIIDDKLSDFSVEADIDTFYYSGIDSLDAPIELNIKYKLPAYTEELNGSIYFTPPFITMLTENPYEKEKRDFPVDYSYAYDTRETYNLTLPENYVIAEKPKSKKARMKKLNFSKIFFGTTNKLECKRNYSRKRTRFGVNEYQVLRSVFDVIVDSDQDIVVFSKI